MILPGFIDSLNVYGAEKLLGDNDGRNIRSRFTEYECCFSFDQDAMNFQEIYRYGVTAELLLHRQMYWQEKQQFFIPMEDILTRC